MTIWRRQGCGFAVERGVWHTLLCHTLKCSTGCLLVLPFPTFVECGHEKGQMATSQDQSEFLVQRDSTPKRRESRMTYKEEVVTISFGLETSGGGSSLSYNTLLPLESFCKK